MLQAVYKVLGPVRRKTAGFTLVELLVVLAMVGILVAILFPAMAISRSKANTTKCLANLRQIGAAALMYTAENDGKIVPPFDPSDSGNPFSRTLWPFHLAKYLGRSSTEAFTRYDEVPAYMCPEKDYAFGYGHNYNWLCKSWGGVLAERMSMNLAVHPGSTVLMADQYHPTTQKWQAYIRPAGWGTWKNKENFTVDFRHYGETCNVLWLDGHATSEKKNSRFTSGTHELWKLYPDQVLEPGLHNKPPS